jgi:hypothetical protein
LRFVVLTDSSAPHLFERHLTTIADETPDRRARLLARLCSTHTIKARLARRPETGNAME